MSYEVPESGALKEIQVLLLKDGEEVGDDEEWDQIQIVHEAREAATRLPVDLIHTGKASVRWEGGLTLAEAARQYETATGQILRDLPGAWEDGKDWISPNRERKYLIKYLLPERRHCAIGWRLKNDKLVEEIIDPEFFECASVENVDWEDSTAKDKFGRLFAHVRVFRSQDDAEVALEASCDSMGEPPEEDGRKYSAAMFQRYEALIQTKEKQAVAARIVADEFFPEGPQRESTAAHLPRAYRYWQSKRSRK